MPLTGKVISQLANDVLRVLERRQLASKILDERRAHFVRQTSLDDELHEFARSMYRTTIPST